MYCLLFLFLWSVFFLIFKHDICLDDRTKCGAGVLEGSVDGFSVMDDLQSLAVVCMQSSIYILATLLWRTTLWQLLDLIFLVDMNSPSFNSLPLCRVWCYCVPNALCWALTLPSQQPNPVLASLSHRNQGDHVCNYKYYLPEWSLLQCAECWQLFQYRLLLLRSCSLIVCSW